MRPSDASQWWLRKLFVFWFFFCVLCSGLNANIYARACAFIQTYIYVYIKEKLLYCNNSKNYWHFFQQSRYHEFSQKMKMMMMMKKMNHINLSVCVFITYINFLLCVFFGLFALVAVVLMQIYIMMMLMLMMKSRSPLPLPHHFIICMKKAVDLFN